MHLQVSRLGWAGLLLIGAFCAPSASGQSSGVIQGVLLDPQGAAIAGAKVTAVDQEKKVIARQSTSGTDGSFQLRPLLPGTYTLRVENAGFKTFERNGLALDPNQIEDLGVVTLQIGDVTDSVTVQGDAPLVETATGQKSYVISPQQVTELSLNGRDFQSLMTTLPGVTTTQGSDFTNVSFGFGATNTFNVNGSRSSMNNVFLDGTVNTDQGDNGSQYTQLSLDAVGEFKVQTGVFNAEYGRNPGVLIAATTKSGGNQFHGTTYEFLRNDALDANNFFRNRQGLGKAKLRFNQFGGNLGGPIPVLGRPGNRKLFFFFNYEGTRGSQPSGNPFVDVPNAASLTGDFRSNFRGVAISTASTFDRGTVFQPGTITRNSSGEITGGTPFGAGCTATFPAPNSPNCNIIPQTSFNQNAPAFLKILSEANRAQGSPTPGAPWLVRVPLGNSHLLRKNQEVTRIDYVISPNTTFFFRWVNDAQHEEDKFGIFTSTPYPVYPMFREKPGSSWSWNLVKVISPTMTNETIFAFAHQSQVVDVVSETDPATFDRDKLGFKFSQLFPSSNIRNRFPGFDCGFGSCNFGTFPSTWQNDGKDYGATENFTFIQGAHTLKTGIYFNLDDKQQQPSWTDAGFFGFGPSQFNPQDSNNGLANLLLGNYTSFTQSNGKFLGSFRFIGLEFYGQDSWKASRRLTIEFGVRYAYLGPTYTRGQVLENYFDPSLYDPSKAVVFDLNNPNPSFRNSIIGGNPFNGMVQESSPGIPSGFGQHRRNQVAPRFGFAYDPFGSGRTSIRGGFGTFFERIRQNVNSFDALGNPPLLYTPQFSAANIDGLGPSLVSSGIRKPVEIRTFDKSNKTPTIYAWSFGIQQQLGARNSLDLSYVGNVGRHLQVIRNVNILPLGTTVGPNNPLPSVNNVADAVRPFKGYTAIDFTGYDGNSSYHALQARFSRRFGTGLTGNIGYTWSKAIDQADTDDNFLGCSFAFNCAREKGPAGFDRTHMLDIDYVYQLPRLGTKLGNAFARTMLDGWEISGVTRFWSGRPFSVGSSTGNPGTLGVGVRADFIGGGPLYLDPRANPSALLYFNPLVFAYPANGTLGNTGRNILRGPGVNNWNFSVFKNTKIGERVTTQLRFEFFNVFNHIQWLAVSLPSNNTTNITGGNPGTPVTAATQGTTGQIISARDPRQIQLGLKLHF
ncbi:MAG TPA: carboxypeptidase regulatory-like domain-containing protein [Candidatus Acidoferrales bacterium]|jgi:hypothetical protein|nr:carboxypeptidase regulatory-like domain-containing protein [Candidatus Acidoferrales bacterium]